MSVYKPRHHVLAAWLWRPYVRVPLVLLTWSFLAGAAVAFMWLAMCAFASLG